MTFVLPVKVRVMAVRSFGRTPLLRVSAAIISEDTEPGVAKASEADFADDDGLDTGSHVHERRFDVTKYALIRRLKHEVTHAFNSRQPCRFIHRKRCTA